MIKTRTQLKIFLLPILLFAIGIVFLGSSHKAEACAWGNNSSPNTFCGYFHGTTDGSGDYVFSSGLGTYDINSFISTISGDISGCNGSHDEVGASFVVLTMMGVSGQQNGPGPTCNQANAELANWESLVTSYSNARLIQWNYCPGVSSPSVGVANCGYGYNINTFYTPSAGGDVEAYDGWDTGSGPVPAIAFMNPSNPTQALYIIKHLCGNPVGSMAGLPPVAVTIGGIIYFNNGGGSIGLSGVPISTCTSNNPVSNGTVSGNAQNSSGGGYSFSLNAGTGFCIRVPGTYTAPDGTKYTNPKITPDSLNPSGGTWNCNGNTTSYEEQIAEEPNSPGSCNYGNIGDTNYNIAYTTITPPNGPFISVTASCSSATIYINNFTSSTAPSGASWTISGGASGTTGAFSGSSPNWSYAVSTGSPSGSHTFTASWNGMTSNTASFTCPNNPCPNWAAEGGPSNPSSVSVNLDEPASGYPDGTSAPSISLLGYAQNGTTYYQDIPNGNYWIADVYDTEWSTTTHLTWSPTGTSPNPNPFTINYNNFIQNYPYDVHFVEIDYYAYYDRQEWVADPANTYYECDWNSYYGGPFVQDNNATCSYSECPEGGTYYSSGGPNGAGCYTAGWVYDPSTSPSCSAYPNSYESGGYCYDLTTGNYDGVASCPNGETNFGGYCYYYSDYATYDGSVCPYYSATLSGSSCVYAAEFLGFGYKKSTDQTNYGYIGPEYMDSNQTCYSTSCSPPPSQAACFSGTCNSPPPTEPACFDRTFSLKPEDYTTTPQYGANTSANVNNPENPTLVTVNGNVRGIFGIGGPAQGAGFESGDGTQINGIDTEVTYDVWHQYANGTWTERPTRYQDVTSGNIASSYSDAANTNYNDSENFPVSTTLAVCLNGSGSCAGCTNCLEYGDEVCIDLSVYPGDGTTYPPYSQGSSTGWEYTSPFGTSQGDTVYQQAASGTVDQWPPSSTTTTPNWPPGICTVPLAAEPYAKVFGGDVAAGWGMKTLSGTNFVCSPNPSANIVAWDNADYTGAGTQLAAFAANTIDQFASAQNLPPGSPVPPQLGVASPSWSYPFGGGFGASASYCNNDYFDQGVNGDGGVKMAQSFTSWTPASGSYVSGAQNITSPITIPDGTQIILYVFGDFDINSNITYASLPSSGAATPSKLPSLVVVATGNINIAHNVSEIDGTYLSQGDINDCYDITPSNMTVDAGSSTPNCQTQLLVKGDLLANGNLNLIRTCNSLHNAYSNETFPSDGSSTNSCNFNTSGGNSTNGAEAIGYSALVWLSGSIQPVTPPVQAITSLPPVL